MADTFSNPMAPLDEEVYEAHDDRAKNDSFSKPLSLSNQDFRKILMTPRTAALPSAKGAAATGTTTNTTAKAAATGGAAVSGQDPNSGIANAEMTRSEKRRLRKARYAVIMRQKKEKSGAPKLNDVGEEDEEYVPASGLQYRDRAKERRDGKITVPEDPEILQTTADYRAVAPSTIVGPSGTGGGKFLQGISSAAKAYNERRRQLIEESKYLGGDMEHTHLVKGLDYALLEKVKNEIQQKEKDEIDELDEELADRDVRGVATMKGGENQFRSTMARNLCATLFQPPTFQRNVLFQPGRMAYRLDLSEDWAEFHVPTTVIRSKADCPQYLNFASATTGGGGGGGGGAVDGGDKSNEMVMEKLIQMLSYLRMSRRQTKKMGKQRNVCEPATEEEEAKTGKKKLSGEVNIYDNIGAYDPTDRGDKQTRRHRHHQHYSYDRKVHHHRSSRREHDSHHHHHRGERHDRDKERTHHRHAEKEHRQTEKRSSSRRAAEPGTGGNAGYFGQSEHDRVAKETEKETMGAQEKKAMLKGAARTQGVTDNPEEEKAREKERLAYIQRKTRITGYDECYPGYMESFDAMGDSDGETDYTKMDLGNRKGPVGRWDFDTTEEYSKYMSSREALPKAAFQYGVKMTDGRKTRKPGEKSIKDDVNKQWQQIQALMHKRKQMGTGDFDGASKVARY